MKRHKTGPADVLEWFQACVNESEANGYEVGQSLASTGQQPGWMQGEDCVTPEIVSIYGQTMIVRLPDGRECVVTVTSLRKVAKATGGKP